MEIVRIDPEIMSGEPCFPGTRVTVQTMVDDLNAGDSLEYFLVQHPTVSRKQAQEFIQASADITVAQIQFAA